jgi:chromosome segregation ATPase
MKNFQQNLLIALALCLCGLCAWQWYGQTQQRADFGRLNAIANQKSALIQGYTNTIQTMQHQIGTMDAHITDLENTMSNNDNMIAGQRRELNQWEAENTALTNAIEQYKDGVAKLEARVKEDNDAIEKQNGELKQLVADRDALLTKYNNLVLDRNNVVSNYNDLAARFVKLQGGGGK